jgi:hypothetical protein
MGNSAAEASEARRASLVDQRTWCRLAPGLPGSETGKRRSTVLGALLPEVAAWLALSPPGEREPPSQVGAPHLGGRLEF